MKQTVFRPIAFMLSIILLVVGLLSSCAHTPPKDAGTTDPTENNTSQIPLVENGASAYTIVFPNTATPGLMNAVTALKTKIKALTGVRLDSLSEASVQTEGDPGKMILIGQTSFPQSTEALDQLPGTCSDEYVITSKEGIIVINSHFDISLADAVLAFIDRAVSYDPGTGTLTVTGILYQGKNTLPTEFDVASIDLYSIVYAAEPVGLESIANSVRDSIRTATGKTLPVVCDTTSAESIFEILIGPTNRPFSQKCYAESAFLMHYEMRVGSGKFQMIVGGPYSAMKCAEKFTARVLVQKEKFTAGVSYYATDYATDSQALTEGADVRVMTSNVLAYHWGEKVDPNIYPVATRCEIYAAVLLRFQPDLVGVQETDDPWMKALPYYLTALAEKEGIRYTHLLRKVQHGSSVVINYSSVLYRSDRYDLNASGCEIFAANYQASMCQRVGAWAKFTSKSDPTQQMILLNTHWAHESEEHILSCVNEEAALVSRLESEYPGVPIFCTGDYNSDPKRKPTDEANNPNVKTRDQYFLQFVEMVSGTVASDAAREKGVLIVPGGCRGKAVPSGEDTRAVDDHFIDHIVLCGGYADVLRHDTILSNRCNVMTDHSAIYADFSLKQPTP